MSRSRAYDHLLLVQRHPVEVGRLRAAIARAEGAAGVTAHALHVLHEKDLSCCRREPWPATLILLLAGEPAKGGADVRS